MKPVDVDANDDWTNMAMVGISPQICIHKKNSCIIHIFECGICLIASSTEVVIFLSNILSYLHFR